MDRKVNQWLRDNNLLSYIFKWFILYIENIIHRFSEIQMDILKHR